MLSYDKYDRFCLPSGRFICHPQYAVRFATVGRQKLKRLLESFILSTTLAGYHRLSLISLIPYR
ncbi:hypothetical protein D918_01258 [Trichuris suis]|nr:hypothetical protein D918_01258 [Trichuris suis]